MVILTEDMVLKAARAPDLDDVVNFNCWGMELSDLSILNRMPEVEVLSLSINNVATLRFFESCTKLRELYLRRNMVASLDEIEYLTHLPELRVLWLSNNPIAAADGYRSTIIRLLPGLTKLDDKDVTSDEREEAIQDGGNHSGDSEVVEDDNTTDVDRDESGHVDFVEDEPPRNDNSSFTPDMAQSSVSHYETPLSLHPHGQTQDTCEAQRATAPNFNESSQAIKKAVLNLLPLLKVNDLSAIVDEASKLLHMQEAVDQLTSA